jgi:hypothetical protein
VHPGLPDVLTEFQLTMYLESLKLILFTNRVFKKSDYLGDFLYDAQVVRDPMYKYTLEAKEKFFNYPCFAFLFAWFGSCPSARDFALNKFEKRN